MQQSSSRYHAPRTSNIHAAAPALARASQRTTRRKPAMPLEAAGKANPSSNAWPHHSHRGANSTTSGSSHVGQIRRNGPVPSGAGVPHRNSVPQVPHHGHRVMRGAPHDGHTGQPFALLLTIASPDTKPAAWERPFYGAARWKNTPPGQRETKVACRRWKKWQPVSPLSGRVRRRPGHAAPLATQPQAGCWDSFRRPAPFQARPVWGGWLCQTGGRPCGGANFIRQIVA